MSDAQSQAKKILGYLQTGATITPLGALKKFGCLRLSGRIYDLRSDGHKITQRMVTVNNGKRVAEYSLGVGVK